MFYYSCDRSAIGIIGGVSRTLTVSVTCDRSAIVLLKVFIDCDRSAKIGFVFITCDRSARMCDGLDMGITRAVVMCIMLLSVS